MQEAITTTIVIIWAASRLQARRRQRVNSSSNSLNKDQAAEDPRAARLSQAALMALCPCSVELQAPLGRRAALDLRWTLEERRLASNLKRVTWVLRIEVLFRHKWRRLATESKATPDWPTHTSLLDLALHLRCVVTLLLIINRAVLATTATSRAETRLAPRQVWLDTMEGRLWPRGLIWLDRLLARKTCWTPLETDQSSKYLCKINL